MEGLYTDKGSKFIASIYPVSSEEESNAILASIRKLHPKARHYCTALRLYTPVFLERISDDGEPSGSAGRPIMGQLVKHDLTQVFVVVTRYFGGTKLGIPGLIEAYKTSTADAISHAEILLRRIYTSIKLSMRYEVYSTFKHSLLHHEILILRETFGEQVELVIGLRKSMAQEKLRQVLHEFSQRDFNEIEKYGDHLSMQLEWQNEEYIR